MRFNTYSNSLSFIDSTGGEGRSESDSHCSTFCCELEKHPYLSFDAGFLCFYVRQSSVGYRDFGRLIADWSQSRASINRFGIAGVIIGFALQDTLSNFAAGMMLLIYRPFDVGDFVHAGGVDGKVSHMSLVNTTIRTFDNQIIIVPNSKIWGDVIKNVTHERIRRVDMVFGIGYSDDLLKAEAVLTDIVKSHPAVLKHLSRISKCIRLTPHRLTLSCVLG